MCTIDFFFTKKSYDIIFHHIFTLGLIHYVLNNPISNDDNIKYSIFYSVLSTEISTNFLLINNILRIYKHQSKINDINNIFFVFTFAYYRLYRFTKLLILNKQANEIFLYNSKNNFEIIIFYFSLYGFYFLNIYWFKLIFSKVFFKTMRFFFRINELEF
jgi:hypothetical protein